MTKRQPTVTIVIPTTGKRPILLARAINSAISITYDIEVIVVANGMTAETFQLPTHEFNGPVRVIRTSQAGVSNARNVGLSAATGMYLRFLDDDDYLIPEAAERQYQLAIATGATVVSGMIKVIDHLDRVFGESQPINTKDPLESLLCASMVVLPLAHVYQTKSIKHLRWNVQRSNAEDVEWLHNVARDAEQDWRVLNEVVGIWYQHADVNRLSYVSINNEATIVSAQEIKNTFELLQSKNRLALNRTKATAIGLWECAHKAFYLSPFFWSKIINYALKINPKTINEYKIYSSVKKIGVSPLVIDWIMIPKRYLNHFTRWVLGCLNGTNFVRRF